MNWLWVALGGAVGASWRYATLLWLGSSPLTVLLVNAAGSFLLGLTLALVGRGLWPEAVRLAFGVGVLGGFTTFSTFSTDLDGLLNQRAYGAAALYAALSVGLCVWCAGLGRTLGEQL